MRSPIPREAGRSSATANARLVRGAWYAVFGVVVAGPPLVWLRVAAAEPVWHELSAVTGLVASSALVCAAVLPSRLRTLTRTFGIETVLGSHRLLGTASAALVLVHLCCAIVADPTRVGLLDLRWAGAAGRAATGATVALVALVVLTVTRPAGQRYELWRAVHVLLAVAVLVLVGLHVLWLDHLVDDAAMAAVLVALGAAVGGVLAHRWAWRTLLDPSTQFTVCRVRRESASVSTLVLEPRRGGWDFAAGQFAWLRLRRPPGAEEHPFTIASSAHRGARIEFTVRHTGDFTDRVAALRPGQRVWVDGPHGSFTAAPRVDAGIVLVAAGVGITPMMSMLRTAADRRDARPYHLVLVARSSRDLLFRDELGALRRRIDLRISEVLAERTGRRVDLDAGLLGSLLAAEWRRARPSAFRFFVCGPPSLVDDAVHALGALGVPAHRVHTEQFDFA